MRIVVIGGGIVGLATAFRFGQTYPNAAVTVLEKESTVGLHQSGHNSGVLHCGLYYKPGSMKARLAVTGIRQMIAFCEEHSIRHEICGKLVVASNEEELPRLHDLFDRGQKNGLSGLQMLGPNEMREIEPHVGGVAAIRVPEEGIVDYPAVCAALVRCIVSSGGRVITLAQVTNLEKKQGQWITKTTAGEYESDYIVNCAGLHCDRVSALAGEKRELRIIPFRGEYYKLKPERQYLVRNLIYPVPDPKFPFLGVHFTRLIHGGIEAGPNAVLAMKREGYSKTDFSTRDLIDTLTYARILALRSEIPSHVLQRTAPFVQQGTLLPVSQCSRTRRSARGPRAWPHRRSRASDHKRWRDRTGLQFCERGARLARAECSQPWCNRIACYRAGDRKPGGRQQYHYRRWS